MCFFFSIAWRRLVDETDRLMVTSGNGTEEIVKALLPRVEEAKIHTHFCSGKLQQVRRAFVGGVGVGVCLLYTSPSPRDKRQSRMPSSA